MFNWVSSGYRLRKGKKTFLEITSLNSHMASKDAATPRTAEEIM
jgi:hypothetical protein